MMFQNSPFYQAALESLNNHDKDIITKSLCTSRGGQDI